MALSLFSGRWAPVNAALPHISRLSGSPMILRHCVWSYGWWFCLDLSLLLCLQAAVLLVKEALPHMSRDSSIVFISSVTAFK